MVVSSDKGLTILSVLMFISYVTPSYQVYKTSGSLQRIIQPAGIGTRDRVCVCVSRNGFFKNCVYKLTLNNMRAVLYIDLTFGFMASSNELLKLGMHYNIQQEIIKYRCKNFAWKLFVFEQI